MIAMHPDEESRNVNPVSAIVHGIIFFMQFSLDLALSTFKRSINFAIATTVFPFRALSHTYELAVSLTLRLFTFEVGLIKKIILNMLNILRPTDQDQTNHHQSASSSNGNHKSLKKESFIKDAKAYIQQTFHKTLCKVLRPFIYSGRLLLSVMKKPKSDQSNCDNYKNLLKCYTNQEEEFAKKKTTPKISNAKFPEENDESNDRNSQTSSKDRIQFIKEIRDLKEKLNTSNRGFAQQKENFQNELKKEREDYEKEIKRLTRELKQAHHNYDQCSSQRTIKFNRERSQFHNELEKLLQRTAQLRQELEKYEIPNNQEKKINNKKENLQEPYVVETLEKIESIKRFTKGLKKKVFDFVGTKTDKEFLSINEQIIKNIINLESIESKGYSMVKKKRLEVLTVNQKLQEELKNKT